MKESILLRINKKKGYIRLLFGVFLLSFLLPLFLAPLATAANNYGPIGSPGTTWGDDIVFNGNEGRSNPYPEIVSISCRDPKTGKSLTNEQKDAIRSISAEALRVYLGDFKAEDVFGEIDLGDSDEAFKDKKNYGMKMGESGFRAFLRGEVELLRGKIIPSKTDIEQKDWAAKRYWGITAQEAISSIKTLDPTDNFSILKKMVQKTDECDGKACAKSAWSKFEKRSLTDNRKDATDHGKGYLWAKSGSASAWVDPDGNASDAWDEVSEYNATWQMSPREGEALANMINTKAKFPTDAFNIPSGCPIADFDTGEKLGLTDFFNDFTGGLTRLILAIPSAILDAVYGVVYPQAWKYAFYTPHTERGDTIFSMETTCTPGDSNPSCSGYKELGFNKNRLDGSGDNKPLFLKLTSMIQWLLSGTYFLILFTSAVLFIFRGKRGQTLQLMKIGPRLALVLMFTFITPFLMGAVISLSNLLVISILGFGQPGGAGASLAKANITSSLIGAFFSEDSDGLIYPIIKFATGLAATIASVMVLVSVYVRQLILIILVITAPVAIFCLIVDSWKPHFKRWIRIFMIVTFFPVMLGIILKIGMLINPIFNLSGKSAENFTQGDAITSFVMLIIMFWAMARAVKMAQGMIGNPGGGALGMAGGLLGQVGQGMRGIPYIGGAAGMALGAAGYGLGRASQAPTDMKAALVPGGRGSMAGKGLFSGGANNPAGGGAPGLPGKLGNSLNEKFSRFAEKGMQEKARRRDLRKDKLNHYLNHSKWSPKGMVRGAAGHKGVQTLLGGENSRINNWINKKAGYSKTLSAEKGQELIAQRHEYEKVLRRQGYSGRKLEDRLHGVMGSKPQLQKDGSYKMQVSKDQYENQRRQENLNVLKRAFETQKGRSAELYKNQTVQRPTGQFDEAGNAIKEYVRERSDGVDLKEFHDFVKMHEGMEDLTPHEIKNLADSMPR